MTPVMEGYTISGNEIAGTLGSLACNGGCDYVPSVVQKVIKKLHADIERAPTESIRWQVETFCSCLSAGLSRYGIDFTLPEFFLVVEEDEFYLEWIFDYYRFGFDFFDKEEHSGWFAIVDRGDDMFRFNARFDGDYRKAIEYALSFISGNHGRMVSCTSCPGDNP